MEHSRCRDDEREGLVIRWMARAIAALLKPKALLVAENLDLLFRIGCSFLSTHSTGKSVLWGQVMLVWVLCTV
jgi:hypothetical protein